MTRPTNAKCDGIPFVRGLYDAILSLHLGNIIFDTQIGDNLTDVYLKGCIVI
jgi:hypothetical protein